MPPPPSRRTLIVAAVPFLFVLMSFLFWYQTWFGRRLTDRKMGQYLADPSASHKTQHALAQLAERMTRGDTRARQWYPQVIAVAGNKEPELRLTAAWVMGLDTRASEFHRALLPLLKDPEPLVRWNAALALVRFGDASGRAELRAMLRPYTLVAPQAGMLRFRVRESDAIRRGSAVAEIQSQGAAAIELRSPLAGRVEQRLTQDGAEVTAGRAVAMLSPGEEQVWESLRALYLVGERDDLADVERFARGSPENSGRLQQQAALAAQAIRQRAVKGDQ